MSSGARVGHPAPVALVASYFGAALLCWLAAAVALVAAAEQLANEGLASQEVLLAVHLVGLAFFSPLDRPGRWAELHTMIGAPEERGRGVGARAVAALMARGWALGLTRIELRVLATNAPARRVYERCGFRLIGVDGAATKHGKAVDVLVMQADQPRSATT